jgi:hypothetical protein
MRKSETKRPALVPHKMLTHSFSVGCQHAQSGAAANIVELAATDINGNAPANGTAFLLQPPSCDAVGDWFCCQEKFLFGSK